MRANYWSILLGFTLIIVGFLTLKSGSMYHYDVPVKFPLFVGGLHIIAGLLFLLNVIKKKPK